MKKSGDLFKGKKITLMGLGLLGRGVGDAVFLAKSCAELIVTDLKTEKELSSSLKSLKKFKNIRFSLGGHRLEDFRNADMVVKAAGVSLDSPFILEAQKNNVPVVMSTALFARRAESKIVGITGTRGKSTVAYLLAEILEEQNKKTSGQVFLGGNVPGVSTLALLPQVGTGDIAVLELDSWQLQGFGNTHNRALPKVLQAFQSGDENKDFSPSIAIFTTFMSDHLNYYQGDMTRYFADKANIYRFQKAEDVLIVSEQVADCIKRFGPAPKSKVIVAKTGDLPSLWKIKILGEHNKLNIALAVAAARVLGVTEKTVQKVVERFEAIPGRLEFVGTHNGVAIYNDTNATTPEATIAGLRAFGADRKTVLIFGGADKKLNPDGLLKILTEYAKALVVLPGTGTEKIKDKLNKISGATPLFFAENMADAVKKALNLARTGDRILMSPAFASFGIFKNEYDRGEQFNAIIRKLKK